MTDPRIAIVRPFTDIPDLNDPQCHARAIDMLRALDAHAAAPQPADVVERVAKAIEAAFPNFLPALCAQLATAALSALPPRDDLAAKPCKLCPHVLACSRCGAAVTRDYEPGVCHGESPAVGGVGTLDEHDQAEPYHEVNGPCSPPHSSKPVAQVSRLVGGPNDSGWYYHDEGCPDEGAVGPFETRDEAEAHAHCAEYRLEERAEEQPSDDLAERFVEFVRNLRNLPVTYFDTIWNELDRLDAARGREL